MTETQIALPKEEYMCGSGKITLPERIAGGKVTNTCRIALVNPGFSDSVVKVYPAQHIRETVLLDRMPGIERWKDIKRLLDQYGPKNRRIPSPVPLHADPKNTTVPTVTEEEIPVVELEGQVLTAPPKVFMQPAAVSVNPEIDLLKANMRELEYSVSLAVKTADQTAQAVERLAKIVENLTGNNVHIEPDVKRGPGRPKKETI